MIELLPWVMKALLRTKTVQPTRTETFTQRSIDINAHRKWKAEQYVQIQENTNAWLSRPQSQRVVYDLKPLKPSDGVVTGADYRKPIGITGGPPVTTTKTTVTYATGKPRTVKF
jgi:hypothetical protein